MYWRQKKFPSSRTKSQNFGRSEWGGCLITGSPFLAMTSPRCSVSHTIRNHTESTVHQYPGQASAGTQFVRKVSRRKPAPPSSFVGFAETEPIARQAQPPLSGRVLLDQLFMDQAFACTKRRLPSQSQGGHWTAYPVQS
ncbi:hypothetical protein CGGC5_v002755 [Colletotrichum fructicola Nara gc5]|uniref:Uncharacterized protein n=1 Tax=Colletotrichum fructicola (strain Nara gc5) TaxID=1213859 RepID=A0A7J6JID9_COLFN|nr:hypothetical protein CGGC5_v002755 [Colletotrichum fructicola Nara gc5]KAF4902652.1 hypothetical protein CGCFRS4_v002268 [Colletotrichum fructicola]